MRAEEFDPDKIKPVAGFDQLDQYIKFLKPTEKFYRIHGNYCGPGNRGGKPVDAIDSVCQLHDVCYMINGYHDKICDQEIVDWVKNIDPTTLSRYQRGIRQAIIRWFEQKLKRSTAESRISFTESWLPEAPQGIEDVATFGPVKFNINDLLDAGLKPTKTIDPSVFNKIELSNNVYYWVENSNHEIVLGVELLKGPDNLTVSLSGKDIDSIGKPPYADKLYQTILQDSGKPTLFSDVKLSSDGKKIWKRLANSGRTVTIYDRVHPGQSRKTISSADELDQFWKMNDPSYERWQYVLSESGSMTHNIMATFNTRRAREITSLGVDQEIF